MEIIVCIFYLLWLLIRQLCIWTFKLVTLPFRLIKEKKQKEKWRIAQEQEEARRKQEQEAVNKRKQARILHFMQSKKVQDIVAQLIQYGLPYKIVITASGITSHHNGGSTTYNFLTYGLENLKDGFFSKTEENDMEMVFLGYAINHLLKDAFTVQKLGEPKYSKYNDELLFYGYNLWRVELTRKLDTL